MVTTTLRDTAPSTSPRGFFWGNIIVKEEEVHHMKKHIIVLAVIAALFIGVLGGQASASASSIHIVESGDTLWDIASDYDITVDDLITWNELDTVNIYPSQELKVEKEPEIYIVVKGDTLFDIAKSHNILLTDLMEWNNISGHLIFPGDQLAFDDTNEPSSHENVLSHPTKMLTPTPAPPIAKAPVVEEPVPEPVPASTPVPPVENKAPSPSSSAKAPSPSSSVKAPVPSPSEASTTKEMTVTATAYTAYCEGCSGITYTGIDLRSNPNQKVIAVDPSVIPLGSRVWVEGYGEAIAGDIGGAIKGYIIDVFLEDKEDALKWGRKTVTIKILE